MVDGKGIIVILVYFAVSILIFLSGFVPAGGVVDISFSPVILSLVLLVPLFVWYRLVGSKFGGKNAKEKIDRKQIIFDVLGLFVLSMVVRIPLVLIMGMSYEKTAVIYLVVLFAMLVRGLSMSSLGFKGKDFVRSILIGIVYYAFYAVALFGTFFASIYFLSGHLVVVSYDPVPALIVFPFMTLCVGVSEEGLFRGFMQTRLGRVFSERRALLIQAVLFGLWHFVWHVSPLDFFGMFIHVLYTFVFGLIFGQFFRVSRSLVPLILAHGLVDTVGYGAILNPELDSASPLVAGAQALSFLVGMIVLALSSKVLARHARR